VKIMRAKEEEYLKKYHKYIKRADSTVSRGT
jgi:hypothetical protein